MKNSEYLARVRRRTLQCNYFMLQHLSQKLWIKNAYAVLWIIISVYMIFSSFFEFTQRPNGVLKLADLLWTVGCFVFVIMRTTPMIVYRHHYDRFINLNDELWSVDDTPLADEFRPMFRTFYKVFLAFAIGMGLSVIGTLFMPFVDEYGLLGMAYYTESTYILVVISQIVFTYFLVLMLISSIGLFVLNATDLVAQMKMLYLRITQVETMSDFRACIDYHYKLQSIFKIFTAIHVFPIIFLYFNTLISACMDAYIITSTNAPFMRKCRSVTFTLSTLCQFGTFAHLCNLLSDEICDISSAWYESNWVDKRQQFRKNIALALQLTQTDFTFRSLKILLVRRLAIIDIVKAMFSYVNLMRRLKQT